jgi:hypothetical protein
MEYLTIGDLSRFSGYTENTLKMLIVDGVLPQSCGRRDKKGIYPISAITRIERYKELISMSMKKSEVVTQVLKELADGC